MSAFVRTITLFVSLALIGAVWLPAHASTTFLTGTVTADGKPVSGAQVTATGNNLTQRTQTDAAGRFAFPNLTPGSYVVMAQATAGSATTSVDVATVGADVTLRLVAKQLGVVSVIASSTVQKAGTDLTLNRKALTRSPAAGNFSELLDQLPGAARGANGVVHINGDHGDINYIVDGVSIPQELNRTIGSELNPNSVSFVDVLEGAFPAQYGGRFAAVLNVNTRSSVGTPGFSGAITAGSYGSLDTSLGYENLVGPGSLVAAFRSEMTQRGSDPPNFDSPHNNASDANQFIRYTLPSGNNYVNFILSHSYVTYQIPVNVDGGGPSSTDDNQTQDDTFSALQFKRAIGSRGALTYGVAYKRSHIRDFGDPANDWAYGQAANLAGGGLSTDCANAFSIPKYNGLTCGYSLSSNRTATDYIVNIDDALSNANHLVRWGALYDVTNVAKLYTVTLQPGNFLAPIFSPSTPNAAFAVVDNAPNNGNSESLYIQDNWRMGSAWKLDYGLRSDSFALQSNEFARGFGMFSPRVKLTRMLGPRSSIYAFYGRFFTPFSFENVSPKAAFTLNLPIQPTVAQFDLKPQRDSDYEIGGHLPVGAGDLGLRVMQKNATDLIDDTQVGLTNLHQDINYQVGRIATQSAILQMPFQAGDNFYVSVNHTYSENKGCETQLLAPCFGSPTDFTPADHEQRWGSNAAILLNNPRGGWFSMDGEYGSGLSSAGCPAGTTGYCKYTPHIVFSAEQGIALGRETTLTARVVNLLNDHFYVTYLNAQGNHYYTGRAVSLSLQFGPR